MSLNSGEPPKPTERPPTIRQKLLAKALTDPTVLTVTEAAKRSGYSHRSTASESLRKPTVQREIARLQASQGDTARSLRKASLSKAVALLDTETDPGRLSQIAVNAATVEEKVGGGDEGHAPPRADGLELARRLLLAFAAGLSVATTGSGRDIMSGVITRLEKLDSEISLYRTVT